MIKQYIKNILPRPAQNFVGHFFNRNNYPYSLNTYFKLPNSISDAFIFSNFCSKIEFVSENLRALLLGHDHEIEHCFTFYSPDGLLLNKVYTKSQKYISRTILDPPNWTDRYFMFTHEIISNTRLDDLIRDPSSRDKLLFCEQSRGYTIYYPDISVKVGATVHGNFGAIKCDKQSISKQRSNHIYTPTYFFYRHNTYDLVFTNPTYADLKVSMMSSIDSSFNSDLTIPPYGTKFFKIEGYNGSLSFLSKMPICRPLVFKNPAPNSLGNFDVFHS